MSEELTDDPRFSGLPASVVENAGKAKCVRCGVRIIEEKGLVGAVMLQYYVPALSVRNRAVLCGTCGLAFREFLTPELAVDPVYQAAAAELRSRWT